MQSKNEAVKANGYHRIDSESHFIVTTSHGFRLHKINGGALTIECSDIKGGLSLCQSYKTTQLFCVVGTGENAEWPRDALFIWNDAEKRRVAELKFEKPIVDLLVVGSWILVASEDKVIPLDMEKDLSVSQIENGIPAKINKRGLIDLYVDE
jgi:hypothetical protein